MLSSVKSCSSKHNLKVLRTWSPFSSYQNTEVVVWSWQQLCLLFWRWTSSLPAPRGHAAAAGLRGIPVERRSVGSWFVFTAHPAWAATVLYDRAREAHHPHKDTPMPVCVCGPEKRNRGAETLQVKSDVDVTARQSCPGKENERSPARRLSPRAVVLRARAVSPEPSRTEVSPPISCQRRGAASRVARRPAMTEATEKMLQQRHCPWICCWRHHDSVCFALINKIWRENKYFWKVLLLGFSVFVLFFFYWLIF